MKTWIALFLFVPMILSAAGTLDIYWIDVEGGAATLIVTPQGETILMDAGWPGYDSRDAKRIRHVLTEQAKASRIDYFITSHYHRDHVGGLDQLAAIVPITKFVDHGETVELARRGGAATWENYLKIAGGKRIEAKPGERLPISGAELRFVASHSRLIEKPLQPAGANSLCADAKLIDEDQGENGKSVGFIVKYGSFEFLDLGDLTWNFEHQLACPQNLLGEVDLFQVTHHGVNTSAAPQHVWSIKPKVAVMNNGPRKGGHPEVFEVLRKSPGLEDLWQVHRAVQLGDEHNIDADRIANLTETEDCQGHWIKASARDDGTFTITNSRNGYSKTYQAR